MVKGKIIILLALASYNMALGQIQRTQGFGKKEQDKRSINSFKDRIGKKSDSAIVNEEFTTEDLKTHCEKHFRKITFGKNRNVLSLASTNNSSLTSIKKTMILSDLSTSLPAFLKVDNNGENNTGTISLFSALSNVEKNPLKHIIKAAGSINLNTNKIFIFNKDYKFKFDLGYTYVISSRLTMKKSDFNNYKKDSEYEMFKAAYKVYKANFAPTKEDYSKSEFDSTEATFKAIDAAIIKCEYEQAQTKKAIESIWYLTTNFNVIQRGTMQYYSIVDTSLLKINTYEVDNLFNSLETGLSGNYRFLNRKWINKKEQNLILGLKGMRQFKAPTLLPNFTNRKTLNTLINKDGLRPGQQLSPDFIIKNDSFEISSWVFMSEVVYSVKVAKGPINMLGVKLNYNRQSFKIYESETNFFNLRGTRLYLGIPIGLTDPNSDEEKDPIILTLGRNWNKFKNEDITINKNTYELRFSMPLSIFGK
jgi:hypothetical protein